jgi:hypothetical protein
MQCIRYDIILYYTILFATLNTTAHKENIAIVLCVRPIRRPIYTGTVLALFNRKAYISQFQF